MLLKIIKTVWKVIKESGADFINNKVMKLSAALAYYTIFSLPPMLIIIITLCDFFYGKEAAEGTVYGQISSFVGPKAALQIQDIISNAALSHGSGIAAVIGVITLVFGATSVFNEIQDSINFIWKLKAKPKRGWFKLLLNRIISFSLVISIGFLLLVSLVVNGVLEIISNQLLHRFPHVEVTIAHIFNLALTFVVTWLLFTIIFKVLPDARIKWKDVGIGAVATAVLFMAGRFAIGYYLGQSRVSSTYGAAASVVIILIWVYYSAIILYFGAVFTKVYAQNFGSRIYPNEYAVWVQQMEIEKEQSLQSKGEEKIVIENKKE